MNRSRYLPSDSYLQQITGRVPIIGERQQVGGLVAGEASARQDGKFDAVICSNIDCERVPDLPMVEQIDRYRA
jgi:hypothetical protein